MSNIEQFAVTNAAVGISVSFIRTDRSDCGLLHYYSVPQTFYCRSQIYDNIVSFKYSTAGCSNFDVEYYPVKGNYSVATFRRN